VDMPSFLPISCIVRYMLSMSISSNLSCRSNLLSSMDCISGLS